MKGKYGKLSRAVIATLSFLVALEVLLRLAAPYLGPEVCNELTRSYTIERGGIYYMDLVSRMQFMRPNQQSRVIFNGYSWTNQTDQRGLRNPPDTPHEIVVLGDSFLYGHASEEPDSAVGLLRRNYHWPIYNAARQGDSLWQEYTIFRLFIEELRPKHLVLTCCANDLLDMDRRGPAEQANPPELREGYIAGVRYNMQDPMYIHPVGTWWSTSYTYRLFRWARHRLSQGSNQPAPMPGPEERRGKLPGEQLYYRLLFEDLVQRCRQAGCSLQVVFIAVDTSAAPDWALEQNTVSTFVKQLCASNKVPFYSLEPLVQGHPEYFLPHDGHLTKAGNEILSQFLARELPKAW